MMSEEGLIENASFTKAWGRVYIPLFEERELEITAKGIHYLEDNSKMKEAGRFLMDKADSIADLIVSVGLDLLL